METLPTTFAQAASLIQGLGNLSPAALIALVSVVALITATTTITAIACKALDVVGKARGG
ncbi:MAG: hypothetical protein JWR07_5031 [Nevskia sp.]|nr:hypothetical protein [Nevskia sp.]